MKWINIEDEVPEKERLLFYFFDCVGVHAGEYDGIEVDYCPETGHVFGGANGWLTGDVTHWMYVPEGFDLKDKESYPAPPEGAYKEGWVEVEDGETSDE